MRVALLFLTLLTLASCSDKEAERDAEAKQHFNKLYKVPPHTDHKKSQGF